MFLPNSCIEFIYTVNEWVTNSRVWTNERKKFSLFLSHVSSSWSWFCKNITQSKEKRREEKRREKKRREEKADSLRSFVNETHKIPMYLSARILLWFQTDVILRLLLFPPLKFVTLPMFSAVNSQDESVFSNLCQKEWHCRSPCSVLTFFLFSYLCRSMRSHRRWSCLVNRSVSEETGGKKWRAKNRM